MNILQELQSTKKVSLYDLNHESNLQEENSCITENSQIITEKEFIQSILEP